MACPICTKPSDPKYTPFCSRRCADVDLSRWLKGGYAIPGAAADEEEDGRSSDNAESPKNGDF
ncbi:MAG: DNA gyrase inhibitor YacG [Alphaproteobacteria bacterium]|nr:MAG: DNA gyrase inhibitor YacG [Alphaproteobacteria bacterium]